MSHDSTTTLPPTQIDDPVAGTTWVVSLSSIIILVALVIATCVFYFRFENLEIDVKVIEPPSQWMTTIKSEQLSELAVYQKYTVTASNGAEESRIRIPIARAMELIVAEPAATPTTATGAQTK